MKKFIFTFLLLLITPLFNIANNQYNGTVDGVVTDAATGELLPGVNVIVKGFHHLGTTTDEKGHYCMRGYYVNDTFVYSFTGYNTKEVVVNSRFATINIALIPFSTLAPDMD